MIERSPSQKSADAYRTISEVAEDLKLPQHVLRFWETRFPQVKPLKRAGGRRFYRREDVDLLRAVKALLYGDGYTIKGVQRMLREQGPRALATLASGVGSPQQPGNGQHGDGVVQDDVGLDPPPERRNTPPVEDRLPQWLLSSADAGPGTSAQEAGVAQHDVGRPVEETTSVTSTASLLGRLQAVMFELAECERLLAAARANQG